MKRVGIKMYSYMKNYPTQNELKELFDYDPNTGNLLWKKEFKTRHIKIGDVAGCLSSDKTYKVIGLNRTKYQINYLVWIWHHGHDSITLDTKLKHTDENKLNTKIENLILIPQKILYKPVKISKNNKSGEKCIMYNSKSNTFSISIQIQRKNILTLDDAVLIRNEIISKLKIVQLYKNTALI